MTQLTAVAKQDDTVVNNIPFVWTSSDTSLATVDNTGLVKFLADGSVTITATWESQNVSGTKAIAITEPDSYSLAITANDSYTTADTPTLTATAQKNGTTDSTATITWSSSDTSIATIDSTGKVTFLAAGSVTFTGTWTQQNVTATKSITVTQAVDEPMTCTITYPDSLNIKIGTSKTLTAHFWKGKTELTNITPIWTITMFPTSYKQYITSIQNGMTITITIAKESCMQYKDFDIMLADSNNICNKELSFSMY